MSSKAVLLDLENNMPTLKLFQEILAHYSAVYMFNCAGKFEFPLEGMTELASLIASGQLIILDTVQSEHKEYEYAVIVGQLMALLDAGTEVELISAMDSGVMLQQMFQASNIACHFIQIEAEHATTEKTKSRIPSVETIKAKPALQLVKKYCDAIGQAKGKPTTLESLKNSVANVLQLEGDAVQKMVGMLMSLKIVKRYDDQISFRKKVLKQWLELDLNAETRSTAPSLTFKLSQQVQAKIEQGIQQEEQDPQQALFKNFHTFDPVQLEVARKLRELKADKPKDIYALRDLLEQMFPKSDVRLLLKELLEKGFIYWNGHEVLYSHEMFLN